MTGDDSVLNIALNELAFATLNHVPYDPSDDTAEAIDRLSNRVRCVGLAVSLALCDVAAAIRETKET